MEDYSLYTAALKTLYISAVINVISLPFISAPYGKHFRGGWGPTIPASLAWFLMESPTIFLTICFYPFGRHVFHPLSLLLVFLYLFHYCNRTLVFPQRLRKGAKGFPISVAAMAFVFNLLNAYVQTRSLSHYSVYEERLSIWVMVRILIGVMVFAWGMWVNVQSDLALLRLKKESGGVYKIPRGGWFEYVCNPNYMGEAAEWFGWAVVAWSPAAWGFFFYTCSNLVPRARTNLRWYGEKFGEEYPKSMKAILPFLF